MISGSGSTLFEELGLYYIGPVDGHNVDDLTAVLNEVKSAETGERRRWACRGPDSWTAEVICSDL